MLKVLPHWFLISWILCFYKPYFHLSRFEAGSSLKLRRVLKEMLDQSFHIVVAYISFVDGPCFLVDV